MSDETQAELRYWAPLSTDMPCLGGRFAFLDEPAECASPQRVREAVPTLGGAGRLVVESTGHGCQDGDTFADLWGGAGERA